MASEPKWVSDARNMATRHEDACRDDEAFRQRRVTWAEMRELFAYLAQEVGHG